MRTKHTTTDHMVMVIIGSLLALLTIAYCLPAHSRERNVVIGDSIALGTGHALHMPTVAKVGAGSCEILRWVYSRARYTHAVISAGINDSGMCVASIRLNVHADQVIWIVPAPINPGAAEVQRIAQKYGDASVSYACKGRCSSVNFHPANYDAVAKAVRRVWSHH